MDVNWQALFSQFPGLQQAVGNAVPQALQQQPAPQGFTGNGVIGVQPQAATGNGVWPTQDPSTMPAWRGMQHWQNQAPQYMANRPTQGNWQPGQWSPQARGQMPGLDPSRAPQFTRPQVDPSIAGAYHSMPPMEGGLRRPIESPAPMPMGGDTPRPMPPMPQGALNAYMSAAPDQPANMNYAYGPGGTSQGVGQMNEQGYGQAQQAYRLAQQLSGAGQPMMDQQAQQMEMARRQRLLMELQGGIGQGGDFRQYQMSGG